MGIFSYLFASDNTRSLRKIEKIVKLVEDKETLAAENVTASYAYSQECGPKSRKLYETLTGIQYGEIEDKHGWCTIL